MFSTNVQKVVDSQVNEFPLPPDKCHCASRVGGGAAAVWWTLTGCRGNITEWEIHRHRKDVTGEWKDKVWP